MDNTTGARLVVAAVITAWALAAIAGAHALYWATEQAIRLAALLIRTLKNRRTT